MHEGKGVREREIRRRKTGEREGGGKRGRTGDDVTVRLSLQKPGRKERRAIERRFIPVLRSIEN